MNWTISVTTPDRTHRRLASPLYQAFPWRRGGRGPRWGRYGRSAIAARDASDDNGRSGLPSPTWQWCTQIMAPRPLRDSDELLVVWFVGNVVGSGAMDPE